MAQIVKGSMTEERSSIFSKYSMYFNSPIKIVLKAHEGISASVFHDVTILFGRKERIAKLLDVSTKTIKRYSNENKKFGASNSEILLKLITIFKKGTEVLGNRAAFLRWLEKPAYGLGENIPYEMMRTSDGIDLVMEELIRIEYGDLA